MKASIIKDTIAYKNQEVPIDDLFNEEFYKYSDTRSDEFYNETYGVNEVFNNLIHYYLSIEKWIETNKPSRVCIKEADDNYYFFAKDICEKLQISVDGTKPFCKTKTWLSFHWSLISSSLYFCYCLLRIPYNKEGIRKTEKFAVVRTKASIKKFKKFPEISQEVESFYEKDSIFRLFPRGKRIGWAMKAYINSLRTFKEMKGFYSPLLGRYFKYAMMDFYRKRIVYAEVYKLMLDEYMAHFNGCEFYTGNNLDRYSVIEDQIRMKYGIKSYCIPHGIEYGYRFPKGFSCDVFYVHSQYTADYLNKLYDTTKYVYDESIIRRMFEYHYDKPHDKMIIFFTEPREVHVNLDIVQGLLPLLKKDGLKLYLKLHPGDNKVNYDGIDIEFITDYDLSMTGNICVSRKSTILIEAIYNNSIPIAIITNPKDSTMFSLFPSLNAEQIIKTYSVDELYETIKRRLN